MAQVSKYFITRIKLFTCYEKLKKEKNDILYLIYELNIKSEKIRKNEWLFKINTF